MSIRGYGRHDHGQKSRRTCDRCVNCLSISGDYDLFLWSLGLFFNIGNRLLDGLGTCRRLLRNSGNRGGMVKLLILVVLLVAQVGALANLCIFK